MSLYEVGRMCMKIAGRDSGKKCVIIEVVDANFVFVDGATRRKKVNVLHLEPLSSVIEIKNKASHDEVKAAFEKLGIGVWDKKSKKVSERPRQIRKVKTKVAEKVAKPKKQAKKEEPSIEDAVAEAPKAEVKTEAKEEPVVEQKEAAPEVKQE
jgi:large subunit ribosomal protein L14e